MDTETIDELRERMDTETIDELRERLARQILEIAIETENPQYKLDAYRAVAAKSTPKAAPAEPTSSMAAWGARLRQVQRAAEEVNGDGVDDEAAPDRG